MTPAALTADAALRIFLFIAFLAAAAVAITHWAVREGRLQPFGWWPRLVRRASDPLLRPIERRLHRFGGNPQQAPLWLAGIVLVAGLIILYVVRWLTGAVLGLGHLAHASPRVWIATLLHFGFVVLRIALIVRVIASWFGGFEHNRWLRPFVFLTEWMLRPLRRVVPRLGFIDITPLVAYLLLIVAERIVLGLVM